MDSRRLRLCTLVYFLYLVVRLATVILERWGWARLKGKELAIRAAKLYAKYDKLFLCIQLLVQGSEQSNS